MSRPPGPLTLLALLFGLALSGCDRTPYANLARDVETDCLRDGGGPEWLAARKTMSLQTYCHAKAAWVRAWYVKDHDPQEWARECVGLPCGRGRTLEPAK